MKQTNTQLCLPLYLCVLCQVLYASFSLEVVVCTAREMLFGGLCAAVAIAFLLWGVMAVGALFVDVATGAFCKQCCAGLACVGFAYGMAQTVLQQVQFYALQFGTGYLWVLLFAVLGCALRCTPQALRRCAAVLLVLSGAVAIVCAVGLFAQSSFARLSADALSEAGLYRAFWAGFVILPEYFALFFGEKGGQTKDKRAKLAEALPFLGLPFFAVAIQTLLLFGGEVVFGTAESAIGGFEFLRSWAVLNVSRFDGVVVLLWLLLAYFRLRFLWFLIAKINPFTLEKRKVGGRCES